jgi:hypothetical protein
MRAFTDRRNLPMCRPDPVANPAHRNPYSYNQRMPSKGDRIELVETHAGVRLRGTVHYADQLQILVKWDNGRSQSLRPAIDHLRLID